MENYKVSNYRYGLPKGTIISKEKIDEDRIRFLEPIKTQSKKKTEVKK